MTAHQVAKRLRAAGFQPVRVSLDCLDEDVVFDAYTDGGTWNGFAVPYFDQASALKIAIAFEREEGFPRLLYNPVTDAFVAHDCEGDEGPPESFSARTIRVGDADVKVYGIGAGSWTWYAVEPATQERMQ